MKTPAPQDHCEAGAAFDKPATPVAFSGFSAQRACSPNPFGVKGGGCSPPSLPTILRKPGRGSFIELNRLHAIPVQGLTLSQRPPGETTAIIHHNGPVLFAHRQL